MLARSSLYRSAPVGYAEQPDFVNAVAQLETSMPAERLLDRTVAVTSVEAGSIGKALHLARENIDCALDILRVAISTYAEYRIHDWQLLQKRGPFSEAKASSRSSAPSSSNTSA